MDYYYDRVTTFNFLQRGFRPSIMHQLKIKFHIFFESEYENRFVNRDPTLPWFRFPFSNDYVPAVVAVGDSVSFEAIGEAVGRAVGERLRDSERRDLIELACKEASDSFSSSTETLPKHIILHLTFEARVSHRYVYVVDGDYPFRVPAAESSSVPLEKHEVDRVRVGEEEEESCCSICLEELTGGGGGGEELRMPCSHVFHGGCIKKWLKCSRCCPLCRYQMPK